MGSSLLKRCSCAAAPRHCFEPPERRSPTTVEAGRSERAHFAAEGGSAPALHEVGPLISYLPHPATWVETHSCGARGSFKRCRPALGYWLVEAPRGAAEAKPGARPDEEQAADASEPALLGDV